jgi:hypothetical protein
LLNFEEVSIGDYVLSGGEMACYVIIDAVLRCLPQVLGKSKSLLEESFGNNQACDSYKYLLEYPQYTKPALWQNMAVPEVLLSGHHQKIKEWQQEQAEIITKQNRPDLYNLYLQNKKSWPLFLPTLHGQWSRSLNSTILHSSLPYLANGGLRATTMAVAVSCIQVKRARAASSFLAVFHLTSSMALCYGKHL